jgi:Fe-S-cluster-containing hydrogenase component 2
MMFEMPLCTGCKTCEMACSFRHTGEFASSVSAIKVSSKKDGRGFLISLAEESDGNSLVCVACRECAQYCPAAGALGEIIKVFARKEQPR